MKSQLYLAILCSILMNYAQSSSSLDVDDLKASETVEIPVLPHFPFGASFNLNKPLSIPIQHISERPDQKMDTESVASDTSTAAVQQDTNVAESVQDTNVAESVQDKPVVAESLLSKEPSQTNQQVSEHEEMVADEKQSQDDNKPLVNLKELVADEKQSQDDNKPLVNLKEPVADEKQSQDDNKPLVNLKEPVVEVEPPKEPIAEPEQSKEPVTESVQLQDPVTERFLPNEHIRHPIRNPTLVPNTALNWFGTTFPVPVPFYPSRVNIVPEKQINKDFVFDEEREQPQMHLSISRDGQPFEIISTAMEPVNDEQHGSLLGSDTAEVLSEEIQRSKDTHTAKSNLTPTEETQSQTTQKPENRDQPTEVSTTDSHGKFETTPNREENQQTTTEASTESQGGFQPITPNREQDEQKTEVSTDNHGQFETTTPTYDNKEIREPCDHQNNRPPFVRPYVVPDFAYANYPFPFNGPMVDDFVPSPWFPHYPYRDQLPIVMESPPQPQVPYMEPGPVTGFYEVARPDVPTNLDSVPSRAQNARKKAHWLNVPKRGSPPPRSPSGIYRQTVVDANGYARPHPTTHQGNHQAHHRRYQHAPTNIRAAYSNFWPSFINPNLRQRVNVYVRNYHRLNI